MTDARAPYERPTLTRGAAMSGSVTSPAGSWSGGSLTGLVDAGCCCWSGFEDPWGGLPPSLVAQWQHWTLLSAVANLCGRASGSGYSFAPSEITLRFLFVGTIPLGGGPNSDGHADTFPPASDLPLTYQVDGTLMTTSDGVTRKCTAIAQKAKANGSAGTDKYATGGTLTLTKADDTGYEGSYSDVNFGSGLCSGSFVAPAPWCGTAPPS